MNKSEFRGFKQVFMFEFITGIQKTGFKVFVAILCAMAFFTMPIILIIGKIKGDDNADNEAIRSAIETVYVYDETGLSVNYDLFGDKEKYKDVSFVTDSEISYSDAVDNLKNEKDHNNLVVKSEYDSEDGFDIAIVHSSKSGISDKELEYFEEDYQEFYRQEVLKNLNVSKEEYEYLSEEISITVMKANEDGSFSEGGSRISYDDYFILIAGLMIVFMFINMSVGNVATSIATEKSSRVIEYLLTGTRPLSLLSGKIAARLLESVIMAFAAYSSYFLSQLVCIFLIAGEKVSESVSDNVVVISSMWESITFSKLVIVVLYFVAGIALYTIIGALTGASVSKLEELQDAYKFYSFIMVICLYADMFLIIMMLNASGLEAFKNFCAIFPLTGAFLTPALILTGKVGMTTGIIALVVLIITAVVAFVLAGAVYESMLLFQGKRIKAKDIIALMKKQVIA